MSNRLLLIDGSSLLSTSYYATLPREIMFEKDSEKKKSMYGKIMHAPDGRYTNGILGFMRTLTKLIDKQKPTHIYIAFDKTRATFRRELYPEYKGQRKDTPEPLKEQYSTIQDILTEVGFAVGVSDVYEADDLIGSAANIFKESAQIRLMTKDQDYFQLVNDDYDIRLWMPMDKKKKEELDEGYRSFFGFVTEIDESPDGMFEFTEETVKDYFGVMPSLVPDLKGIAGDTADNIPGVRGVASAAAPLLNEYGSLEAILEAIDDCDGNAKKEKLLNDFWKQQLGVSRSPLKAFKEYRDIGILSKKLATIKTDCAIDVTLDNMDLRNINYERLDSLYSELGMESLRNKK